MKHLKYFIFISILLSSLNGFGQSTNNNWLENLELTKKGKKKVLLVLLKENLCEPTKGNLTKLLKNAYFIEASKDYIIYKLEQKNYDYTSEESMLFRKFQKDFKLTVTPAMAILNNKGELIKRINGCIACRKNVISQLAPNNPFLNN